MVLQVAGVRRLERLCQRHIGGDRLRHGGWDRRGVRQPGQRFIGGAMQLAMLIKGFEVWGPWKQYIMNSLVPAGVVGTAASAGSNA